MNRIMLTGRLTKDPEVAYTASGTVLTSFNLAENIYNHKTKETKAQFIRIVCFGKKAEAIGNNLSKGRKITVDGELRISEYQNKNGEKRISHQVVLRNFDFADNKK